ncbi:hypothetical protein M2336_001665 [Sphingobium sp. B1D7B]|nr:hypothetical protein [Sphingobium sp. B1D7B]
MLGGNATSLQRFAGGDWTPVIEELDASSWRFDQFGDLVIGVNGSEPVKFDLITGTGEVLGGSPPISDLVATVRQQVFLAGDPDARNVLSISGYNDAEGWTAGTNQSLVVPFPSGGDIMGLAGGETGLILQKRSIKRATYTGDGVTWWQFDEISRDIGCMAKGSVAQAGQTVFFLSEQGFKATDRNTVIPIGQDKIDRYFFQTYSRADIDRIQAAVDPRSTTVIWAMPGTPGRLWAYNWTLARWTTLDIGNLGVFSGFTSNIAIDAVDAVFPDGIDTIPISLDSPFFAGGNPLFLVIGNNRTVGTLSGAYLPARFTTQPAMIVSGKRVRIRSARPIGDAAGGVVSIDRRARASDEQTLVASGNVRANGSVALRANGLYIGAVHDVPSTPWTYMAGLELQCETEGER